MYNLSTSELGLGIHYLSLIYSQKDYQTTAINIQLLVTPRPISTIMVSESTLIQKPGEVINFTLRLIDPLTLEPILGAFITYSWEFGTGYLEELGDGYYKLTEIVPSQEKTYTININLNLGGEYESKSLEVTVVSSRVIGSNNQMFTILISIIAGILGLAAGWILYKQKILIPKRDSELLALREKVQVIDDVYNLKGLMIIQKSSGLLLYKHLFDEGGEMEDHIFTGFLQAILLFSTQFSEDKKAKTTEEKNLTASDILNPQEIHSKYSFLEFNHNNFHILVVDGEFARVALILEEDASDKLRKSAIRLLSEFETPFGIMLNTWDGNTDMFAQATTPLVHKAFDLTLLSDYTLAREKARLELVRTYVPVGSLEETVYRICETLANERIYFQIKTVVNLIGDANQLRAKSILLSFIQKKLLIPVNPTEKAIEVLSKEQSGPK